MNDSQMDALAIAWDAISYKLGGATTWNEVHELRAALKTIEGMLYPEV